MFPNNNDAFANNIAKYHGNFSQIFMSLPTEETIRQVTDLGNLQEACLSLVRVCEKERESKKQYRTTASLLKKELESLQLELGCLKEKNEVLVQCVAESQNNTPVSNDGNINQLKEQLDEKITIENDLKQQLEDLWNKMSENAKEITEKTDIIHTIKKDIQQLQEQNASLKSTLSQKDMVIQSLQVSSEKSGGNADDNSSSLHELINKLQQDITQKEETIQSLLKEKADLKDTLYEVNQMSQKDQQALADLLTFQEQVQSQALEINNLNFKITELNSLLQQKEEDNNTLISIIEANKEKAKERINKAQLTATQQIEQYQAEISALNQQFSDQKALLESQIHDLNEEKKKIREENKNKINKLRNLKKSQKAHINQLKQEIATKDSTISSLDIQVHDLKQQNSTMIAKIADFQKKQNDFVDFKDNTSDLQATIRQLKIDLQEANEELRQRETIKTDYLTIIADREASISNFKSQLQQSLKNEQQQQDKLARTQEELTRMTEKVAELSRGFADSQVDEITRLHKENSELLERLRNSGASTDLVQKNRKLSELLEKSNRMYIKLQEHTKKLEVQLGISNETHTTNMIINHIEIFNKDVKTSHKKKRSLPREPILVQNTYLKQVLLQFFTEEENARESLVPIILQLVGCTQEQIRAAMRQWERNSHLISKTSNIFGWF